MKSWKGSSLIFIALCMCIFWLAIDVHTDFLLAETSFHGRFGYWMWKGDRSKKVLKVKYASKKPSEEIVVATELVVAFFFEPKVWKIMTVFLWLSSLKLKKELRASDLEMSD